MQVDLSLPYRSMELELENGIGKAEVKKICTKWKIRGR